jgi:hypothetical protein
MLYQGKIISTSCLASHFCISGIYRHDMCMVEYIRKGMPDPENLHDKAVRTTPLYVVPLTSYFYFQLGSHVRQVILSDRWYQPSGIKVHFNLHLHLLEFCN